MLQHGATKAKVEGSVEDESTNEVGIDVRGWASVLDISFSIISSDLSGDSERGSAVSDSERESFFARSLVLTGKSLLVIVTVAGTVKFMVLGEILHHVENVLHAT